MDENNAQSNVEKASILDTIMGSQTQTSLNNFEPARMVGGLLALLKERDRQIVMKRFGLEGQEVETLESIGQRYNLTRERVRQIEKDSVAFLKRKNVRELQDALQLIFDTVIEHGNIMSEDFLMRTMLLNRPEGREAASLKFLLSLSEQLKYHKEINQHYSAWSIIGFSLNRLNEVVEQFVSILHEHGKVVSQDELYAKFKETEYFKQHALELSDRVLKSYLNIAKVVQVNPFNEIGLKDWSEVKPRDVGDKAYLVLKHHNKPEHYSVITKMINEHRFDDRTAYQETVHNELIKDERFVLIGRGIYALTEWGYKKGVVADVIKEVLSSSSKPLTREEIIAEVMKRRQVKRNTILVGLSNKKYFQKVGKDKYALAETQI
ncbi:MAG TPA: sigma factor-like helix-turn-helix DNA-binding protein [Candidatus Binatia bacterium]|nr:sigma factor-like helix-turn-helix DNA-binding protein [Candidatus Binatia bacterium]